MRRMVCPTHPGEILKEDVLPELGITVTEAANQLGVTRVALSRVINGKAGISPDMALRLAAWLGSSPESWINMQSAYNLFTKHRKRNALISSLCKKLRMLNHRRQITTLIFQAGIDLEATDLLILMVGES